MEGAPVVIVDDVCTTGNSTIEAVGAARQAGLRVIGAACLVERTEADGRGAVEAALSGLCTRQLRLTLGEGAYCVGCAGAALAPPTGWLVSSWTSTRRFLARPLAVALSATAWSLPRPIR